MLIPAEALTVNVPLFIALKSALAVFNDFFSSFSFSRYSSILASSISRYFSAASSSPVTSSSVLSLVYVFFDSINLASEFIAEIVLVTRSLSVFNVTASLFKTANSLRFPVRISEDLYSPDFIVNSVSFSSNLVFSFLASPIVSTSFSFCFMISSILASTNFFFEKANRAYSFSFCFNSYQISLTLRRDSASVDKSA